MGALGISTIVMSVTGPTPPPPDVPPVPDGSSGVPGPSGARPRRRGAGLVVVALALGAFLALVGAAGAVVEALAARDGVVDTTVSVDPAALQGAFVGSGGTTVEPFPGVGVDVRLTGLDAGLAARFVVADVLAAALWLVVAAACAWLAVRVARRRAAWREFALATGAVAVALVLLGTVAAVVTKGAQEAAGAAVAAGTWTEPGFLAGIDLGPAALGVVLGVVAVCLLVTARQADDLEGLV